MKPPPKKTEIKLPEDAEVWELEFADDRPHDRFEVLHDIDTSLCAGASITKITSRRFLLFWSEHHPECFEDAQGYVEIYGRWNERHYKKLKKQLPDKHFSKIISRREAFRLILYFSALPEEFYPDAAL